MSENGEQLSSPNIPEVIVKTPEAHLFTGSHPMSEDKANSYFGSLNNDGNLSVRSWSGDEIKKLKEIPGGVSVLALDGANFKNDSTIDSKKWTWIDLPATPSELNSSGTFTLVMGDSSEYRNVVMNFFNKNTSKDDLEKIKDVLNKDRSNVESIKTTGTRDFPAPETLPIYLAAIVATLAMAIPIERHMENQINQDKFLGKDMPRRRALQMLGLWSATAAATYGGIMGLSKILPRKTVSIESNDSNLSIMLKALEGKFLEHPTDAIDFRTAILVEKAIVAGQLLNEQHVEIVAGTNHKHNEKLLIDPHERSKAITKYGQYIKEVLDEACNVAGLDEKGKENAWDYLVGYFSKGQMFTVKDPGVSSVDKSQVDKIIGDAIQPKNVRGTDNGVFDCVLIKNALKPPQPETAPNSSPGISVDLTQTKVF